MVSAALVYSAALQIPERCFFGKAEQCGLYRVSEPHAQDVVLGVGV
jgi:hypothetical protein